MIWIVNALCEGCRYQESLEVESRIPPYELGDEMGMCRCGGKLIVEEILEVD